MNGGKMSNSNKCRCKPTFLGRCCEIPVSASVDRCDREIRAPDGGDLKCGRAKPEPVNPMDQDQAKLRNGRERLPYNWSCTAKCPSGQGMYRSTNDVIQCKHEGWKGTSFAQRSFNFDSYDDSTPSLPLPDCAPRNTVMGVTADFALEFTAPAAGIPSGLEALIEAQCGKPTKGAKLGLDFNVSYTINENGFGRRGRREESAEAAPEETAPEEAATTAAPSTTFSIEINAGIKSRFPKNTGWANQDMARSLMRDCVGSVLGAFEANIGTADDEGFVGTQSQAPDNMDSDNWPAWDLAGSGCLDG